MSNGEDFERYGILMFYVKSGRLNTQICGRNSIFLISYVFSVLPIRIIILILMIMIMIIIMKTAHLTQTFQ